MIGCELAERMSGGATHVWAQPVGDGGPHGRAVREERGLRIARFHQLVIGTVEAEPRQGEAERRIRPIENRLRRSVRRCEILSHPRLLRSLPGKEQHDVHAPVRQSRTTEDAQVKPAPKASISTSEPSPTSPFCVASSSAIGIDADDVFP